MKRLPFVVLALAISAVVVTVSLAQQPTPTAPKPSPFFGPSPAPVAKVGAWPVDPAAEEAAEAIDPEALRTQLLELIKQKLDMMDGSELRSALTEEQGALDERHATRKLDEVRQALKAVADEHPQTRAGRQATSILSMWDSGGSYRQL